MGLRRLLAPVSLVFSMLILGGKFNANGAKFGSDLAFVEKLVPPKHNEWKNMLIITILFNCALSKTLGTLLTLCIFLTFAE